MQRMDSARDFLPATELAAQIRRRGIGIAEYLQAALARIERVNPKLNAIVSLQAEAAMAQARAMDNATPGEDQPLWGMPIAIKDLVLTAGIRTTFGSPSPRTGGSWPHRRSC